VPAGTTIGHVHLHVGDIDSARSFYHDGLGFDITVSTYPGALFMAAGGYHHHLGVNTWAGPQAVPPTGSEPRLLNWDLVLPDQTDVKRAADSLTAAGFDVTSEEAVGTIARDPWQTAVRIIAEP
jgi:catechol 2,3-dioxygenase